MSSFATLKPGQNVTCEVTKVPSNEDAQQTIEKLMRKDMNHKRNLRKAQIKRADRISAWMEATRIAGFGVAEANGLFGVPKLLPGVDLRLRPPAEARADFLARHAELLAACA